MEIESLRLDFLTLIIRINIKQKPTTYQSISEKEEKKKKVSHDPGCARPQAAPDPGRRYRRGVLEVLLSFFCFFLSSFLFGCSENHKV